MKKMLEYLSASLSLFLSLCFSFCYLRASFFLSFFLYIQGREESAFELSARSLANGFVKAKRRTRLYLSTSLSLSLFLLRNDRCRCRGCGCGCRRGGVTARTVQFVFVATRRFVTARRVRFWRRERYRRATVSRGV